MLGRSRRTEKSLLIESGCASKNPKDVISSLNYNESDCTLGIIALSESQKENPENAINQECQIYFEEEFNVEDNNEENGIVEHAMNEPALTIEDTSTLVPCGQAHYQTRRKKTFQGYEDHGEKNLACEFCGALFWFAERLKKRSTRTKPLFSLCCLENKIRLPLLPLTPGFLSNLLDLRNGQASRTFRDNIRVYNSMFAFTSMGANVDTSINARPGPYVFKINGQINHLMGSLLPFEGETPKFAQLYIYDTQNEIHNRVNAVNPSQKNANIDFNIVDGLIRMLNEINDLVKLFRTARDKIHEDCITPLRIRLLGKRKRDERQYDLPTSDEIGGLIVGDIGQFEPERDIIIEHRGGQLQRITKFHPKFMALQYPLLFPYGNDGYTLDLKWNDGFKRYIPKREKLTMRCFLAYQLQDRAAVSNHVLKCGRLFQQYVVDAYAAIEEERLDYIRRNQKNLRSEIYKGIHDALSKGDTHASDVGKRIILPASYTGSVRYMINNYHDAMSICRTFGNPDLFITFTCNVKWPEIVRELNKNPGFKAEDRPDIVSRVFKLKLDDMMTYIKSGKPFGKLMANVYTIEFQKRGLPHCHILVWLQSDFKCLSARDIDSIISAEIPDKEVDPVAYEIVAQCMLHGPCGVANPNSPCMEGQSCSKKFPKRFKSETIIEPTGFVNYKRRDNDDSKVLKNGIELGNDFVVPFNRELLVRYNAHINVESCCQSTLIKYLFKYLNKGTDRARVALQGKEHDEIFAYRSCRYLSPYEAIWRTFQYDIHSREPSVIRLPVHLPLQQNVVFEAHSLLNSVVNQPGVEHTMLTRWFDANSLYPDGRELSYSQYPSKFVWNSKLKLWCRRKMGRSIGRISYVHPAAGELYYLRILLNCQKGATSFDTLKTVHGMVHSTYQAACTALGLLGDDKEWNEAIEEASITASSHELRQLFVTLILFCDVANPRLLFETHWHVMCDDIRKKLQNAFSMPNLHLPDCDLQNYVLYELEQLFNASSNSLASYDLPLPDNEKMLEIKNKLLREELNYDIDKLKQLHSVLITQLNKEQRYIYDRVITTVERKENGLFFVNGHGGTGKTFLWHAIITKIRSDAQIVLAVASSGIASLLLPNGRTAHSRFKIPLSTNECSTCQIKKGTHLAKLILDCVLVVWDEAPMSHKNCFEALDRTLRDMYTNSSIDSPSQPFGGKPLLLGGDFKQILPVVPGGTRDDIIDASICSSYLWPFFEVFFLHQNMRLLNVGLTDEEKQKLSEFADWILSVGDGKINTFGDSCDDDASLIEIPPDLLISPCENPIQSIFYATYSGFEENFADPSYLQERVIITPKNEVVSEINNYILDLVPNDKQTYLSSDSICSSDRNFENLDLLYPIEFLNQLEFNGLPVHRLSLKLGTPIMLLRNLNQAAGLCNGTRLVVTQLTNRIIEAKIMTGSNIGDKVYIPRIVLSATETKWPFVLKRRQFPIRVCYAMTINKSQGQSLKKVGLYLPQPVFTHGQLYVALSRVTSRNGIKIMINNNEEMPDNYTKNIVYKDVLNCLYRGTPS